ncbi:MAG: transcription termination factor NusA [Christensenellaceae bacterium]
MNKEFFSALEDLVKEKGISQEEMIATLENALLIAYNKTGDSGEKNKSANVRIKLVPERSTVKFYATRSIVEEVVDPEKEISLKEAQLRKKSYKIGDTYEEEFVPKDFGRIAAQTAKQVVLQKIREVERDNSLSEVEDKEGEIQNCKIRRIDEKGIYVEIGGSQIEGVMLPQDQVPGEKYALNDTVLVYVKKVKSVGKNAQIFVSRTSQGLVRKLFENEVPEIKQGIIEIKSISREPGARTKIAIYSNDPSIDAVGACVGARGARVNSIVSQLGGEKIDIILWSEDPLEYIAKALSPAKVLKVSATEGEKVAHVVVPDDKLSLAIGKEGQNARLAARLTGWRVDVKSKSKAVADGEFEEETVSVSQDVE